MLYYFFHNLILPKYLKRYNRGSEFVVCARVGGANITPHFLAVHFAKRNTKFYGGGKRGRAKIPSPPTPFLFARPSVQFGTRSAPSVPFKKGSDFVK